MFLCWFYNVFVVSVAVLIVLGPSKLLIASFLTKAIPWYVVHRFVHQTLQLVANHCFPSQSPRFLFNASMSGLSPIWK